MTDAGPSDAAPFPAIGDYALIGDCGSAALVSRAGSIEWLCWPRFDSASLFAAILDRARGGSFGVGPASCADPADVKRRYCNDTAVLETTFRCAGGVLRVRDCMAVARGSAAGALRAEHQILREVTCLEGELDVELHCEPRFEYGLRRARAEARGPLGVFFQRRGSVVVLRSELPYRVRDGIVRGGARLRAGERRWVSLSYDEYEPAALPPLGDEADRALGDTLDYWRDWIARCSYRGPHRAAVLRSALTLKLMTVSAFGPLVAAPTTSLPEKIGGVRNWDYRYCWVRDACLTLRALLELGYTEEGESFFSWLLHTAHENRTELRVLYNLMGGVPAPERELRHLGGYRASRPVRVGNAAQSQLQLDVYGELAACAAEYFVRGGNLSAWTGRLLRRLGERACVLWRTPDQGIWEIRAEPRRHVVSAGMCGLALDRLLAIAHATGVEFPVERFARTRDEIRRAIEREGWNEEIGSYTSEWGGRDVDASLLLLALYGYFDPKDARMRATFARIQRELCFDELVIRYETQGRDGLPPGEGAFGICSFWVVEYLARIGEVDEAERRFVRLLRHANDVGLFAEEIDPRGGAALGNFPQAFTHVGLVNAALAIDAARAPRPESPPPRKQAGDL